MAMSGYCHIHGPFAGTYCDVCTGFAVNPAKRLFATGATRDSDAGKPDYEGFLSPLVLERYGRYMDKHRTMSDGSLRASDNWQQGVPQSSYMKSGWRHFMDWWACHRGHPATETLEDALCALLFNVMGYLHVVLSARVPTELDADPTQLFSTVDDEP
ncbi:MAG: hypothetical protein P1P84_02740 [Deferrisomatales bacterium]|nr:hypothetical protein [Deferrisomatales bacterium]